ncbi:MAG TPA: substrate-binding domain-containing protein [Terriglobales bacterium]|nr:substrate-binding domain-containing protein [Terriglobales bacterium]
MFSIRRFASVLLSFATLIPLCACSKHDGDEQYYLITANTQIPYWQSAAAGFFKAAEQMKVRAEVDGPDTYDPQAEKVAFDKAVAAKPSGILVSAGDAELLRPSIDAAINAGIPVITIDSDSPVSKRLFFVGTNNYDAGVRGGELAVKQLHGKGNLVIFTMPSQANLNARLRGYQKIFDAYPQIKTRIVDMKGDPRVVFDETQKILDKKEPVDGFLCLEAQGGKEVASVLNNNHVTGKLVIAMDTDDDTLDWIRKGVIEATIAQKPYTMGYFGMQMLDDFHHKRLTASEAATNADDPNADLPTFVDTGSTLINRGNVDGVIEAQQNSKQKKS